jgi:hypothetical protein
MRNRPVVSVRKALIIALGLAMLTACDNGSGGDSTAPQVASVSQAPDAESSASAAPHGPQARLDTTSAEKTDWTRVYSQCLVDHGLVLNDAEKRNMQLKGYADDKKAPAAARDACVTKKPELLPPQMDPAKNPRYREQWHEDVECLKRKGMPIEELDDGWTYTSPNAKVPANEEELERQCDIEAFSK